MLNPFLCIFKYALYLHLWTANQILPHHIIYSNNQSEIAASYIIKVFNHCFVHMVQAWCLPWQMPISFTVCPGVCPDCLSGLCQSKSQHAVRVHSLVWEAPCVLLFDKWMLPLLSVGEVHHNMIRLVWFWTIWAVQFYIILRLWWRMDRRTFVEWPIEILPAFHRL